MTSPTTITARQLQAIWQTYLKPHRLQLFLLALLLATTLALQLVNPQVIRLFLEAANGSDPFARLLRLGGLFLLIAVISQGLGILTTYISEDVSWKATNRLREDVALHCLRLDRSFHKAHTPGEMTERLDGDVLALSHFFSQFGLNLLNNILLLVGILAILWATSWQIGLSVTIISVLALFAVNVVRQKAEPHWAAVSVSNADLYGFLEEQLNGTVDIRSLGATSYVIKKLYLWQRKRMDAAFGAFRWLVVSLGLPVTALSLASIVVFIFGSRIHLIEGYSVATVYLVFHYVGLLSGPVWQIVHQIQDLQRSGASIRRIQALRDTKSLIPDDGQEMLPQKAAFGVTFDQLSFHYEDDETYVLNDISFELKAGQTLGLLGHTGSGKSTLINLLLRQIDPTEGSITFDTGVTQVRTDQLPLRELRKHVGIVTQQVQLFNATVRDNLTFFSPDIPDPMLLEAIRRVGLHEWLGQLPGGLDCVIGSGGRGLSAGEAQLLAFVRIFLQDPALVILDEASSRLDPITERFVTQAVSKLLKNRTGIIIAHHLNTIQTADQILILDQGHVQEYGLRSDLQRNRNSRFNELLHTNLIFDAPLETTAEGEEV